MCTSAAIRFIRFRAALASTCSSRVRPLRLVESLVALLRSVARAYVCDVDAFDSGARLLREPLAEVSSSTTASLLESPLRIRGRPVCRTLTGESYKHENFRYKLLLLQCGRKQSMTKEKVAKTEMVEKQDLFKKFTNYL